MHDENGKSHHKLLLEMENLKVICALGRGAEGVVFLIRTDDGKLLALKAIQRSSFERKKKKVLNSSAFDDYRRVFFDADVLASFDHPLLPKLHGIVVTDKVVGYAMDYCSGGDLNSLRKQQTEKMFSEDSIRFYAAELVLALEYLHNLGIVHRDLKPENVMVQENGHLMLVDFDLSTKLPYKPPDPQPVTQLKPEIKSRKRKKFAFLFKRRDSGISPEDSSRGKWTTCSESSSVAKSNSFVGTEEYLAPEIILGDGHDFAVDWWCLGVVLYEMLYGTTPFRGANRRDIFSRILKKAPDLTGNATPLRDLIGKLLEKDPRKRIDVGGIKRHEFFEAVDWGSVTEMPRPPFIPELTDVEVMMGNKEINVETFVHEVFTLDNMTEYQRPMG